MRACGLRRAHLTVSALLYDSGMDNDCRVFLYISKGNIPLHFAVHPWFVVNRDGVETRWEVLHQKHKSNTSWGYLHKDALAPKTGMQIIPLLPFRWNAQCIGEVSGPIAEEVEKNLGASPNTYPYAKHYSLLGPNSNSFASWVLGQIPSWKIQLPKNAFGKSFRFKK